VLFSVQFSVLEIRGNDILANCMCSAQCTCMLLTENKLLLIHTCINSTNTTNIKISVAPKSGTKTCNHPCVPVIPTSLEQFAIELLIIYLPLRITKRLCYSAGTLSSLCHRAPLITGIST